MNEKIRVKNIKNRTLAVNTYSKVEIAKFNDKLLEKLLEVKLGIK